MTNSTRRIAEAVSEHIVELSQTRLSEMVASYKTLTRANQELGYITGIQSFFANLREFQEFQHSVALPVPKSGARENREWGDFQTPPTLAKRVCEYLAQTGVSPMVVVEPTYGLGNFILAALDLFPKLKLVYGVEVQSDYEWHLKIALLIKALIGHRASTRIELHHDSIFTHQFPAYVTESKNILIVGNPPWVTNAELGVLESQNLPTKQNLKSLNGMDALTGKSNFDIAEYILLQLLDQFSARKGTLAMLCKRATAKNIIEVLPRKQYRVCNLRTLEFDAAKEFGVAVEACLLVMDVGRADSQFTCAVAPLAQPDAIEKTFGWTNGKFVSDVNVYAAHPQLDGKSPFEWRQGIKHDCSTVMELEAKNAHWVNRADETVNVESDRVYWLLKGSDLRGFVATPPRKKIIITQSKPGEDTFALAHSAPRLWKYLQAHKNCFDARKSSIYRGKPPFSIFGIGAYSFKPFKVAISGLHKEPIFSLVLPIDDQPVMLDDTCYLIGFDNYKDALITASLLNSPNVKQFLRSIVFTDAKRPYTKDALMRIDLAQAASSLSFAQLQKFWRAINFEPRENITQIDIEEYCVRLLEMVNVV